MNQSESQPKRSFPLVSLLVAQFFGAFNDNAFKMIVVLLGMSSVAAGDEVGAQGVATMAFVTLTLPLMLGSIPAMLVGDRVGKRDLIVFTKGFELLLMVGGTVALALQPHGWLPYLVLAGLGLQSALFAPGKYGLLPEVLPPERLTAANGRLEAASFVAIILGTVAGGLLLQHGGSVWIAGAVLSALSLVGFVAALRLPRVPAAGRGGAPLATLRAAVGAVRSGRVLGYAVLGTALFWSLASLLGQDVLVYAKQHLELADDVAAVPFALFAIGVGVGSLLAGRIAAGRIEPGLIAVGAIGLSLGTAAMSLLQPGMFGTFVWMGVLGAASGLIIVPLNALVQLHAPADRRGAVIALCNLVSFAGMLLGNLGCLLLARVGFGSVAIIALAAAFGSLVTVALVARMPATVLRLVLRTIARTLYRLRVVGRGNVPAAGAALLVPNHVSFADGLLLMAATDREIRFVVDREWYEWPLLKPLWRLIGAIPISASGGPRVVLRALREAGEALDEGHVVCLFAEGEISRMGSTLAFRRGMSRLVKGRDAVVVPVHLDRLYGGLGSVQQGRLRWWFADVHAPVTVSFGEPMPNDVRPDEVRTAVEGLAADAVAARSDELPPLHVPFVRSARRVPWRSCLVDTQGRTRSRVGALAGAVVLARRLSPSWRQQQRVGLLLPPSVAGGVAAVAISLAGRTAVPLNYTVGAASMASAIRQAGLQTVITSRAFLDRLPPDLVDGLAAVRLVLLEDVTVGVDRGERLGALLRALLLPIGMLERSCGAGRRVAASDVATILFSSGSTGEPKGVVLTHANVQSNCAAVAQVVPFDRSDTLASVLPSFHSFGNMALWFAIGQGARIAFHANPLEAEVVGDLVAGHAASVLIATPTFLQLYHRRCEPGQFGSLRLVLTGAEKLRDQLADEFEDRFGIRPVQGYGVTECAPVIATSATGFRSSGVYQAGARRGSVGRPVPGVAVRIVDPETREALPVGESGMVLVRGPNVMSGYLDRDDLTAAAMHDGYYVTGDIGYVDADGFLFLTDRLSRFSKIGGEMVPHGVVEEHLQASSERPDRVFAVCGVPDASKGERLAVLTTLPAERIDDVLARLQRRGLPPLFVPRRNQFRHVAELPLLGTGKLDLRRVRELASRTPEEVDDACA